MIPLSPYHYSFEQIMWLYNEHQQWMEQTDWTLNSEMKPHMEFSVSNLEKILI